MEYKEKKKISFQCTFLFKTWNDKQLICRTNYSTIF